MTPRAAFFLVLVLFLLPAAPPCLYAGMVDEDNSLESKKLYRVRMDGRLPCEYLQVTLADSPADLQPDKKRLVKILLLASDKKTVLQRLTACELTFDGSTAEQGDFNFDGYRDFRSLRWQESGTGGRHFTHFIFDPRKHRYVPSAALDELSSPCADYQEKRVWSFSRGGGMYSTFRKYRWVHGRLIVVSEVWRDRDAQGWFTEYSTFKNGVKTHSTRIHASGE